MVTITPINDSDQDDNNKKQDKDRNSCRVCGGKCTTRCSICQLVYYCSVKCQRFDWNDGGHRKTCIGKIRKRKKSKSTKDNIIIGPSLPPPSIVRDESEAERAIKELWSTTTEYLSTVPDGGEGTKTKTTKTKTANVIPDKKEDKSKTISSSQEGIEMDWQLVDDDEVDDNSKDKDKYKTQGIEIDSQLVDDDNDDKSKTISSFVVEEMPQICTYQLTIRRQKSHLLSSLCYEESLFNESLISVKAKPIGLSGSSTLVNICYDDRKSTTTTTTLFAGEFPRLIDASEITWRVIKSTDDDDNDDNNDNDDSSSSTVIIIFRLRYPYDPCTDIGGGGGETTGYSSTTTTTCSLNDINGVICGSCYQPLLIKSNNNTCDNDDGNVSSSSSSSSSLVIRRVFPLPVGHWDEIADYLICYDGQPVVDFAAGSVCSEPSVALQDANMLCLHRKDVEMAICALAVDGYGEFTERDNDNIDRGGGGGGGGGDDSEADLLSSSSFMLPTEGNNYFQPSSLSSSTVKKEKEKEESKDDADSKNSKPAETSMEEEKPSSSSAVVRGDRTWQSATDGESVSLCCGRCCSPLGFASLGSPETWRLWKHRLFIPSIKQNDASFVHPKYRPLGSCSSFLARELVRYAESKAIFTFVVRCEDNYSGMEETSNKCLLLRLLSWETTMATSFEEFSPCFSSQDSSNNSNDISKSRRNLHRLNFRRITKIVFEETIDPTAKINGHSTHNNNDSSTTQWFWGGIDLCCLPPPPPSNKIPPTDEGVNSEQQTTTDATMAPKAASTVKLQLPREEYDQVLSDLVFGRSYFTKEMAEATIMLKMGGLWEGLGLTAVAL
ncbi:MAG: hypothetical protein ACI8RD_001626 [Bacillariaceae sp.]|jgi:hypothetical protein